jgi:hypothetical protein
VILNTFISWEIGGFDRVTLCQNKIITKFKEIVRAYKILDNQETREKYNQSSYRTDFEEEYLMTEEEESWTVIERLDFELEILDKQIAELEDYGRRLENLERNIDECRSEMQESQRPKVIINMPKISLFWKEEKKHLWSSKTKTPILVGYYNKIIEPTNSIYQKIKNNILEIILEEKGEWKFEKLPMKRKRGKRGQNCYENYEEFMVRSSFKNDNYDKNDDLVIDYGKIHWEGGFGEEKLTKIKQEILGKTQRESRQEIRSINSCFLPALTVTFGGLVFSLILFFWRRSRNKNKRLNRQS